MLIYATGNKLLELCPVGGAIFRKAYKVFYIRLHEWQFLRVFDPKADPPSKQLIVGADFLKNNIFAYDPIIIITPDIEECINYTSEKRS